MALDKKGVLSVLVLYLKLLIHVFSWCTATAEHICSYVSEGEAPESGIRSWAADVFIDPVLVKPAIRSERHSNSTR
jgi:hypothetical protein